MAQFAQVILYVIGIAIGFIFGGMNERRHMRDLDTRELDLQNVTLSNLKTVPDMDQVSACTVVLGQVVVATDYYKSFVTTLRNLVGGEMRAAHNLMLRARRESLLRMVDSARSFGSNEVCNIRFEFSNVAQMNGNSGAMQVEILCYGTAVKRTPTQPHHVPA